MPAPAFLARQERFAVVASTNDVVRDWLADGTPEVCLAVADEQSAGRGRDGRTWHAPAGSALLMSLGFRPTYLAPDAAWRLAATVSLAMADAAEEAAGLPDRTIRLKWPNDLVIEGGARPADSADPDNPEPDDPEPDDPAAGSAAVRKLAGVLGESSGLGTADPTVVVGLGINADWPASRFPPELAGSMTSLREASGGRPVDLARLLDAFTSRLEVRIEALRGGRFDVADWFERQVTTGREIVLVRPDGSTETVRAVGLDPASGALRVVPADGNGAEGPSSPDPTGVERSIVVGEVRHVRLASRPRVAV